jgi:hypothetical protein
MGLTTNCAIKLEERYDSSTSQGLRQPTVTRGVPEEGLIVRCDVGLSFHSLLLYAKPLRINDQLIEKIRAY